jgi:thioredoxin-like negative regulator of GroEL
MNNLVLETPVVQTAAPRRNTMKELRILTIDDWSRVLTEEKPILVDFQAPWCPPQLLCHAAFVKLALEVGDRIEMFQLDASRFLPVAMTYRLFDFPALLLFKEGKLLKAYMGMDRVEEMKRFLDGYFEMNNSLSV